MEGCTVGVIHIPGGMLFFKNRDLANLLRSHVPDKGELSICNHRQDGGGTESSHIIQIQGDCVGWSSLIGYPCENDYQTAQLFQG